jgi:hypothetical protein
MAAKAARRKLGPPADPSGTASRYCVKLQSISLDRLGRELRGTYQAARQMNRVLSAYRLENEGNLPLLSSPEAPLVLAIGNKFYYIARELARRGVKPKNDQMLGGTDFADFFSEVAQRTEAFDKETVDQSFLTRFAGKVRSLLRGSR